MTLADSKAHNITAVLRMCECSPNNLILFDFNKKRERDTKPGECQNKEKLHGQLQHKPISDCEQVRCKEALRVLGQIKKELQNLGINDVMRALG